MPVFRDVEAPVTATPNIVCNSGLDIGDMAVNPLAGNVIIERTRCGAGIF